MLHYFGTDLDNRGHHFWDLEGNGIYSSRIGFGDCPFNPEALPHRKKGQWLRNGTSRFYSFAGFSIYAIEGSCADSRPASKSIFFVEGEIGKEEMKALILSTPIANKIIQNMPFEVEW